jgi:signal transduction histidine kinase
MLQQSLSTTETDQNVEKMLYQAFEQRVTNIDQSIVLANEVLDISNKQENLLDQANAKAHLAYFHMIIGEHVEARAFALSAKPIFEENNNYIGLGMLQYAIGSTYYKTEDYHLGLKHLTDSFLMYQEADDIIGQSRALKSIGSIYEFFKEYTFAQETYLKCVTLSKLCNDKNGISNAYNALSGIYLRNNQIDLALDVIEQSIQLKIETKDDRGLAFAYYGKGKVLAYQEKYDEAESLYLKSIDIFNANNEMVGIMMCHNKLGKLYSVQGRPKIAKEHLNLVLTKGKIINHYLIMYKACFALYELEKRENNASEALKHLEQHLAYKEKVINKETKNVIQSIKSISRMELLEQQTRWQKEKTEEVELKNAELDTFVYKVSHDLKGPISSLLGLNEVVKIEINDQDSIRYFDMYHSQIQRLHGILLDFISLTQIKKKELSVTKIHFNDLVDECINAHQYYDNFKNIKFDLNIDGLPFNSDKSTVNTILQNLIENAIKYTRNDVDPKVAISIIEEENSLVIKVADNGVGIKEEYQSRIFEMFFRANDKVHGSGLGLYILKNAVEKLKGVISFKSELNIGSEFVVSIPKNSES